MLGKLASFVSSKDSRLACAAAVLLTELAPKNSSIVKQLVRGLEHADAVRRPFIIEALGRIGTAEAAAALVPLIKADGTASEQALRAIAHMASAALKPLLEMLGHVSPSLLERIAECAARTGESVAFSSLLGRLKNADVDICRAIRGGLRIALTGLDDKSKITLRKNLDKAFHDSALTRHHPSLIALMKISGDLGDISFHRYLMDQTNNEHPAYVRRAALQSLTLLHFSGEQRGKLAPRLLPLIADSDIANVAEPALEALRHAQLDSGHENHLRKLLNSPSSRIREFAMQTLAFQGSTRTLGDLVACLDSPDRSMREDALGALARAPSAAGLLCERLLNLEGGEPATETARALAPQATNIPKKLLTTLASQYISLSMGNGQKKSQDGDLTQRHDDKKKAILNIFRIADSSALVEAAFLGAHKLRQNDEPHRAYELLKTVHGYSGWNDDHRVELALSGVSIGSRDLARMSRSGDSNLRVLEEVLASGRRSAKELARQIIKDPLLNRKALYYLGFHFAERLQSERQFGQLLLEHLMAGRADEGKQAREKLVMEGLLTIKGAKTGILEERARILMSAADIAAKHAAEPDRGLKKAAKKSVVKARSSGVRKR